MRLRRSGPRLRGGGSRASRGAAGPLDGPGRDSARPLPDGLVAGGARDLGACEDSSAKTTRMSTAVSRASAAIEWGSMAQPASGTRAAPMMLGGWGGGPDGLRCHGRVPSSAVRSWTLAWNAGAERTAELPQLVGRDLLGVSGWMVSGANFRRGLAPGGVLLESVAHTPPPHAWG